MAGGVDQVEDIGLAVVGGVFDAHGLGLDRDAALALDIHAVEHLLLHVAVGDGLRSPGSAGRQGWICRGRYGRRWRNCGYGRGLSWAPDMRGIAGVRQWGLAWRGLVPGIAGDGLAEAVPVGWRGGDTRTRRLGLKRRARRADGAQSSAVEAMPNGNGSHPDAGLTVGSPGCGALALGRVRASSGVTPALQGGSRSDRGCGPLGPRSVRANAYWTASPA